MLYKMSLSNTYCRGRIRISVLQGHGGMGRSRPSDLTGIERDPEFSRRDSVSRDERVVALCCLLGCLSLAHRL